MYENIDMERTGILLKELPDWAYDSIKEFHDKVGDIRFNI